MTPRKPGISLSAVGALRSAEELARTSSVPNGVSDLQQKEVNSGIRISKKETSQCLQR